VSGILALSIGHSHLPQYILASPTAPGPDGSLMETWRTTHQCH